MTDPLVVLSALTDLDAFAPELAWIVVDETGAAEASVELTDLSDVEVHEVAAAVTRGTADVEWLTEGESRVLRYSDATPEADTDGAVPAGVWFYDGTSEALRFFLPVEPGAGFADWPILEPVDGLVRVRRSTMTAVAPAVTSVAGVSPVDGDVDAESLADALEPFLPAPVGGGWDWQQRAGTGGIVSFAGGIATLRVELMWDAGSVPVIADPPGPVMLGTVHADHAPAEPVQTVAAWHMGMDAGHLLVVVDDAAGSVAGTPYGVWVMDTTGTLSDVDDATPVLSQVSYWRAG